MPNAILFKDTPIAIPIAIPEPHPIKLYVKLFITNLQITTLPNDQCVSSAFSAF